MTFVLQIVFLQNYKILKDNNNDYIYNSMFKVECRVKLLEQ